MPTLASDHRRSQSPLLPNPLWVWTACGVCCAHTDTHSSRGAFHGLFWQMFAIWQQQQQQQPPRPCFLQSSLPIFALVFGHSGMLGFEFGCGFVYSSRPGKTFLLYIAWYQLNISFGFSHFPHGRRRLLSQLKVICLSCFMSKLMEIHHNNRDVVKGEASASSGQSGIHVYGIAL